MHPYIIPLANKYRDHGDPVIAEGSKKYMLNQYEFFGIYAPLRKEIHRELVKTHGLPGEEALGPIIEELWALPERDFQYFGMFLAEKSAKKAGASQIDLYEYMITHKSWWDTVDYIAGNLTGTHFRRYPEMIIPVTAKWMKSGNMWLQRSSLLFQLTYKDKTDTRLMFDYILSLTSSKEFFIQKAIGWVLRQYSKTDPETVIDFVNTHQLPALSKREALKVINRRQNF